MVAFPRLIGSDDSSPGDQVPGIGSSISVEPIDSTVACSHLYEQNTSSLAIMVESYSPNHKYNREQAAEDNKYDSNRAQHIITGVTIINTPISRSFDVTIGVV